MKNTPRQPCRTESTSLGGYRGRRSGHREGRGLPAGVGESDALQDPTFGFFLVRGRG